MPKITYKLKIKKIEKIERKYDTLEQTKDMIKHFKECNPEYSNFEIFKVLETEESV